MEEQPGYHATGRSAAIFAESYGNQVVRALTRASRAFLEAPGPGFAEHPLLLPRGLLFIARRDQLPHLDRLQREIGAAGPVRRAEPAEAVARVPILRRDYLAAALVDEAAMDVEVHALHQGYLKVLKAAGGEVVTGARATSLERAGGAWTVRTSEGDFRAPLVVDAAGAWADEVGALAGALRIDLTPLRRTCLVVPAPPGVAVAGWPLVIDAEEAFYFKPDAGRILVSPADETPSTPCDARPADLDVAVAVDRFTACCDIEVSHVQRRWAGLRSFVADRTPVVGFDPRAPGFFWLAGQGGYGIQTAPALSRLCAALALGEPVPEDLAALGVTEADLSPRRFATPDWPPAR